MRREFDPLQPPLEAAVITRSQDVQLERIIGELSDDTTPRPERTRQVRRRQRAVTKKPTNTRVPRPTRFAVERIIDGSELTAVSYLQRGLDVARSICRVVVRGSDGRAVGYGTGCLIADGVLLTNQHVLTSAAEVARSSAQFGYELDLNGDALTPVEFRFTAEPAPIINEDLDFSVCAVSPVSTDDQGLAQFGWNRLDPTPGKAFIGEYLTIIQHPRGEPKQICVRENKLLKYDADGPYIWYQTDTVGGSSGSPVFNNSWDVVALHHSGVPRTRVDKAGKVIYLTRDKKPWDSSTMTDDDIDWFANEGIRVSRIVEYLNQREPEHPLTQRILRAPVSPRPESSRPNESRAMADEPGVIRINVPIEIRVGGTVPFAAAGSSPGRTPTAALDPDGAEPSLRAPLPTERVDIDQTNYDIRNGYQPDFLADDIDLPLPTLTQAAKKSFGPAANGGRPLKYYNYSVLLSAKRRLAYYSVCNVDAAAFEGERAKGDTWYLDPRLKTDPPVEIGEEWYGSQRQFEVDRRRLNPFDRGHLSARNHLQWGATLAEAKRNGNDSFHFSNCTPQHWQFNQNNDANGLWFATEDEVLKRGTSGRLCVINGPIFDAPDSSPDGLGWILNTDGARTADPEFGDVQIPKQFFKIIAWRENNKIRCVAFIVTQEGLLAAVDRIRWTKPPKPHEGAGLTDGEVAMYRVPVAVVGRLTGLGLTSWAKHESAKALEGVDLARPLESESDLAKSLAR